MIISNTRLYEVEKMARDLMAQHGLKDWRFGFDRAVSRTGQCKYPWMGRPGRISLSTFYAGNPATKSEDIMDTILHEIAHALVGIGHHHDAVWQAKCREIGAKPVRCAGPKIAQKAEYKWKATCGGCGGVFGMYRNKLNGRRSWCAPCGRERGLLNFVKVY